MELNLTPEQKIIIGTWAANFIVLINRNNVNRLFCGTYARNVPGNGGAFMLSNIVVNTLSKWFTANMGRLISANKIVYPKVNTQIKNRSAWRAQYLDLLNQLESIFKILKKTQQEYDLAFRELANLYKTTISIDPIRNDCTGG